MWLENIPNASPQRGKTPLNECPECDIEQSDGLALTFGIRAMQSTTSLLLLQSLLEPRVVAPEGALSIGQIEQTV